jgi:signal transduction histidine kinase
MRSLQSRLAVGLSISLVLLLSLQWWLVGVSIRAMLEQQLESRLSHDAQSLLAGLSFTAEGRPIIDRRRLNAVYERPFSGRYYMVRMGGFVDNSRSLWDERLEVADLAVGDETTLQVRGPENQRLFVFAAAYQKHGTPVLIAVGEDLTEQNASITRFQALYGVVSAAVLVVLLLVQARILRRGMQPLDALQRELSRLGLGETERIEARVPSEIEPVVNELNRQLCFAGNRTRRSRAALGNLAHSLKTQLAVLTQITARPELHRLPELRRALEQSIESVRRIVERELRRARIVGAAMPSQRFPLEGEVAALMNTMRQIHARKPLALNADVFPDTMFAGDREDFLELLGNLVDNACKWCRQQVIVTVTPSGGVSLRVEDDGPGCPEAQLEDLVSRGFRGDESKPGSGLGLAIVADVVDSYGGRLSFGRSEKLGGLLVEISLPDIRAALFNAKGERT